MIVSFFGSLIKPAAFRRLCVETAWEGCWHCSTHPAAFRRLCVETFVLSQIDAYLIQPPSGGCVLKQRYFECA